MGKLYRLPRSHSNIWLRFLPLIGIFALTFMLVYSITLTDSVAALTLKQGSYGEEVKDLQQQLQWQGFYSGKIDGVYGANTAQAVRLMQKKYGLPVDGLAGPQTLQALGLGDSPSSGGDSSGQVAGAAASAQPADPSGLSPDEITLLARVIQAEAESEPYIGKVAVGAVLLNRVSDPNFPNTLAGVVYQPLAFTSVANGRIYKACGEESLRAAKDAASGWDPSYGCLYFWNPAKATSAWIWTRQVAIRYGNHVFGI